MSHGKAHLVQAWVQELINPGEEITIQMNQPESGGSGLVQTKITISEVTEWAMGKLIWFKYESRNELILVKKLSSKWTQKAGKCVISNLSDIVQDYRDKCLKDKEGVAVLAASYREIGEHSGQQQHSSPRMSIGIQPMRYRLIGSTRVAPRASLPIMPT